MMRDTRSLYLLVSILHNFSSVYVHVCNFNKVTLVYTMVRSLTHFYVHVNILRDLAAKEGSVINL